MKIVNNKMNFTEAVDLITLMTKFAYNIDGEGFEKMYKEIGLDGGGYAMEKFHKMQNNFSWWWNELDRNTRICIVDWVRKNMK